jgi:hypothetical protein
MSEFIEPPIEDASSFEEPSFALAQNVPSKAADLIASQAAIIQASTFAPDELENIYIQTIAQVNTTGAEGIKGAIAARQAGDYLSIYQQEAVQALESGELNDEAFTLATLYGVQESRKFQDMALEQAFSDKILQMMVEDPEKETMIQAIAESVEGDPLDIIRRTAERGLQLQRKIMEEDDRLTEQPLLIDIIEGVISGFIPFTEYANLMGMSLEEDLGVSLGSEAATSLNKRYYEMSDEEYSKFYDSLDKSLSDSFTYGFVSSRNELENLELLTNLYQPSYERQVGMDTSFFIDALDVLGTAGGIVSSLRKGGTALSDAAPRGVHLRQDGKAQNVALFGQRKLAANITLDSLGNPTKKAAGTERDPNIASNDVVPSAIKDPDYVSPSDVSNTSTILTKGDVDRFNKLIDSIYRDERLTTEEKGQAMVDTYNELRSVYGPSEVTDVFISPVSEKGVTKVFMAIGREDGDFFLSRAEAEKAIEVRKLPIDSKVFQASDSGFYIRVERDINEKNIQLNVEDLPDQHSIFTYLKSPSTTLPPEVFGAGQRGGALKGYYSREVQPINKIIESLPKDKFKRLTSVLIEGNYENPEMGSWYNRLQFEAVYDRLHPDHKASQQEWDAYLAFRMKNDIDHAFLNWSIYIDKKTQGYVTGRLNFNGFNVGDVNVRKVNSIDSTGNMSIFDVDKGETVGGKSISVIDMNKKLSQGYELWQFDTSYKTGDGHHANHLLVKKGEVRTGSLKFMQLPYRHGGHRSPYANFYLKQPRVGKFKNGQKYILNPLTYAGSATRRPLEDVAERMNQVIDIYKKINDPVDPMPRGKAAQAMREAGFEGGLKRFEEQVKDGLINPDEYFQVLSKDTNPYVRFDNEVDEANSVRMDNVSTVTSMLERQGIPFYRGRGTKPLTGPDGERANIIDPMRVLEQSLSNSMHKGNLANFKAEMWNRWFGSFGEAFKNEKGLSKFQTFMKKTSLTADDFTDRHPNPEYIQRAINSHHALRTMLMTHNRNAKILDKATKKVADVAEGKGQDGLAEFTYNLGTKDPVGALRSLTYDIHLGLGAPDQIFAQGSTALVVAAMDGPVKGSRYLSRASLFQILNRLTSEDHLNFVAKKWYSKAEDIEDFKEFVRIGREAGIIEIRNDMAVLDANNNVKHGALSVSNVREKGRALVMAVERFNVATGYAKAWDEIRKDVSLKDMRKKENLDRLLAAKEKWSISMSAESAARWQKDYGSAPAQFFPYTARMIEKFYLPKRLGGDPNISFPERFKMQASQIILLGALNGSIVGAFMSDSVDDALTQMGVEHDSNLSVFVHGGLVDLALVNALGGTISDRAGIGAGVRQTIDRLRGKDIADSGMFDIFGGPLYSTMFNLGSSSLSAVGGAFDLFRSLYSDTISTDAAVTNFGTDMRNFVRNINTADDFIKAYYIVKYGEFLSRSGKSVAEVDSELSAIGVVLGLTPIEATATYRGYTWKLNTDENVKKLVKEVDPYVEQYKVIQRSFLRGDGDKEQLIRGMEQTLGGINAAMYGLPPAVKTKIVNKLTNLDTFADYVSDEVYRSLSKYKGD